MGGGKLMLLDRIEWIVMPDPTTASAALQKGEVDWWEDPISDLMPANHLHPPFNDVRARRAILMALSQEDYMRAYAGDDDNLWKPLPGFLRTGQRQFEIQFFPHSTATNSLPACSYVQTP
jgi:peptide/nickel transport system substrate-binding protein